MFSIRREVFETNSSSSHSIAIKGKDNNMIEVLKNRYSGKQICIVLGEYDWGYDKLKTFEERLSYIVTMIVSCSGLSYLDSTKAEDIYELEGFKEVEKILKEKIGCNFVVIEENNISDCYVDHLSCYSLHEFLDKFGLTLEDYLFNDKYCVIIDNDNH